MIRHQKRLKRIALQTLKKYGEKKLPINVKRLSEKMNIPVIAYQKMSNIQKELYIDKISNPAITVCSGTIHTIYYDPARSDCDQWIAHELAHIILGHESDNEENEKAANFFAHYLRYRESHIKQYLAALLAGVAIGCAIGLFCTINSNSNNKDDVETVYITPSGEKYHASKSCAGLNAVVIPLDIAQKLQKSPCLVCVD